MISTATMIWLACGALFSFALPIGLLIWWRKTRHAKLTPFFVGALTFFVFALVLEPLLHQVCLVSDNAVSRALNASPFLYALYGALAAGVFEETGRYIAFRFLLPKKRFPERDTAVTYGIGHGGIEAILLMGLTYLTYIGLAAYLNAGAPGGGAIPGLGEALPAVEAALKTLTPGAILAALLERAGAILLHIALSCFVFLAARDRTKRMWFPIAILIHAVVDFPAALCQRGILPQAAVEIWFWVVTLYALRSARKRYLEAMDP